MKKYVVIPVLYFISSCSLQKEAVVGKLKSIPIEEVVKKLNHYTLPKTFKARANIHFRSEGTNKQVSASVRMLKDKIIWMNVSVLGFSVVKIKITPTKFEYLNRLESRYISANIDGIEKVVGVKVSFGHIQSILLGKAVFEVNRDDISLGQRCTVDTENPYAKQRLLVSIPDVNIHNQQIQEHKTKNKVLITYGDFVSYSNMSIPNKIKMYIIAKDRTSIEIDYRGVQVGMPLEFPFKIPDDYERQTL